MQKRFLEGPVDTGSCSGFRKISLDLMSSPKVIPSLKNIKCILIKQQVFFFKSLKINSDYANPPRKS